VITDGRAGGARILDHHRVGRGRSWRRPRSLLAVLHPHGGARFVALREASGRSAISVALRSSEDFPAATLMRRLLVEEAEGATDAKVRACPDSEVWRSSGSQDEALDGVEDVVADFVNQTAARSDPRGLTRRASVGEGRDMVTDRYAAELTALAKSDKPLSEAMEIFTQIFDAYMVEMPGSFVAKRKALLQAFRDKAPDTPLTWPIIDKLGGLDGPEGAAGK
jgi:hypothetical protein